MARFDGNQRTADAFFQAQGHPFPVQLRGYTYNGTSGDDQIYGSDFAQQTRMTSDFNGNRYPVTDRVFGWDTLSGGDGADYIDGRGGDDIINGGNGGDTLIGGSGYDTVSFKGSIGTVTIRLGEGSAHNNYGSDTFSGFEVIEGSENWDKIWVSGGNQVVYAGTETADVFVVNQGDVFNVTWADFQDGRDAIEWDRTWDFDRGSLNIYESGSSTVIDFGGGGVLTLLNTSPWQIDRSDFIYD